MFVVIELQSYGDSLQYLVSTHATLREAESKFHTVLAAAAQSPVPVHSAIVMDHCGNVIRSDCYKNYGVEGD